MKALSAGGNSTLGEVVSRRLGSVLLTGAPRERPEDVVRHLTAVQSQDYWPALWSLGQRSLADGVVAPDVGPQDPVPPDSVPPDSVSQDSVHAAFQAGRIVRTHVLRPTWHFVLPEDLGWLLALTGPRVHQLNAYYYRQLGLDAAAFSRSEAVLADALAGGVHLTRAQLIERLTGAGLPPSGLGLAYVLMHAELEGLICSGPMVGRQHTHALLAGRAPGGRVLSREDAVAELTLRYFTSHGPATAKDLRWWSSLPLSDIAAGIEAAGDRLERTVVDGLTLYSAPTTTLEPARAGPLVQLVQGYDEYVVGYAESKRLLDPTGAARALARDTNQFNSLILLDGEVAGMWKRTVRRDDVLVQLDLLRDLPPEAADALDSAVTEHAAFLGLPATRRLVRPNAVPGARRD